MQTLKNCSLQGNICVLVFAYVFAPTVHTDLIEKGSKEVPNNSKNAKIKMKPWNKCISNSFQIQTIRTQRE
jgi:hypothetical protein